MDRRWRREIDSALSTSIGSDGTGIDLAFDPVDRNPSVSWGATKLVIVHRTGAAWKLETIEKYSATNDITSLAYAPDGSPAIAYAFDADRNGSYDTLKLARWNGTAWKTEVVETGVVGYGVFASLAFDALGNIAVRELPFEGSVPMAGPLACQPGGEGEFSERRNS